MHRSSEQLCKVCGRLACMDGMVFCAACLLLPAQTGVSDCRPEFDQAEMIGRYLIGERVGVGGFADVYAARHKDDPDLEMKLALKILRPGMDSREILARFDLEQKLLRRLHHPGIVNIEDAGLAPQGRPFFVMEMIDGLPITEYCRVAQLSLRQRVRLFVEVCDAVQHAHQKSVLHRDLKPANILITETKEGPRAKVIDFGIGKALDPTGSGETIATTMGLLIGTPAYVSPEQAGGTDEADTRSDIYSLGAVLYEVLCGSPPWKPDELHRIPAHELRHYLTTHHPPPPSERLKQGKAIGTELRQIQGDLDHIVQQAMAPTPEGRYASVSSLSEDLRRWLTGLPVSARSPSLIYQLALLLRLYKWQSAAAIVGLAGVITSSVLAIRLASHERNDARNLAAERDRALAAERTGSLAMVHAEHQNYRTAIRSAQLQMAASQPYLAREQLLETRSNLRGWEWHALMAALPAPVVEMNTDILRATEMASSPDGRFVAVAAVKELQLLDTQKRIMLKRYFFDRPVGRLAVSEDGQRIAVILTSSEPGTALLRVIRQDGTRLWELAIAPVADVLWEPQAHGGALLCVSSEVTNETTAEARGQIRRLDSADGHLLNERNFPRGRNAEGRSLVLGPSGRLLAVRRDYATFELVRLPTFEHVSSITQKKRAYVADVLVDEALERLIFAQQTYVYATGCEGVEPELLAWFALRKSNSPPSGDNHEQPVRRLNWMPDGRWVAMGDTIRRLDQEIAKLSPTVSDLQCLSLAGGRRLSLLHGGRIMILDDDPARAPADMPSKSMHTGYGGRRIAISPDSRTVAVMSKRRQIMCYASLPEMEKPLRTPLQESDALDAATLPVFHPNGEAITWGKSGVEAQLFKGGTITVRTLPVNVETWSAAVSLDAQQVAFGHKTGVQILDWTTNQITREHSMTGGPFLVFPGQSKDVFYALGSNGLLRRLGAGALSFNLGSVRTPDFPPIAAAHAGRQLLAVGTPEGVAIYQLDDTASPHLVTTLSLRGSITAIAFDEEGERLGVASEQEPLTIWDWFHQLMLLEVPLRSSCSSIAFSHDGKYLLHADGNPSVILYGEKN